MQFSLLVAAALAAVGSATPLDLTKGIFPRQSNNGTNATAPCASVSQIVASATRGPIGLQTTPTVPAKLAYECLNSIPLNQSSALDLVEAVKPYVNWQSTLAWLKDPPSDYVSNVQPAVDIMASLDDVRSKVSSGTYKSEYQFGWALYKAIQQAHDGHFTYVPDSVGSIFTWGRPVTLVSISDDGAALPSIYAYQDVLGSYSGNITYTPSAVTKINGQDAALFLENFSEYGSLQDRDALWNNLFYELPQVALGVYGTGTGMFAGGGRGRYVYPGDETVLAFANGTTRAYENFARAQVSFRNVKSGEDVAKNYFVFDSTQVTLENEAEVDEATTGTTSTSTASSPAGYPSAVVRQKFRNWIAGYYLDAAGYEDVAVLAIPSFVGDSSQEEFQSVAKQFLAQAKSDGKTKLVIDLSANGGGTILLAYDLFKQLFPNLEPYGANRFRAHEAVDLIGQQFSNYSEGLPRTLDLNSTASEIVSSYFNYQTDMDANGKPFDSWAEKYGPHASHNDEYTTLARWNLSDPLITLDSGGINITGYGSLSNASAAQPPFAAEDIVIVTDGYCASTCTIFTEFMHHQAGVKTVAMGGRPNTNSIQAVGGVKGVNNFQWTYIQSIAVEALDLATDADDAAALEATELGNYLDNLPFNRVATTPGVNVRDGLRNGSDIPLQFVYETADCRLFYTAAMTVDITEMWKTVVDSIWSSDSKCVDKILSTTYGRQALRRSNLRKGKALMSPRSTPKAKGAEWFAALEKTLDTYTDLKNSDLDADGMMYP